MYSALALENPSKERGTVYGPCGLRARLCLGHCTFNGDRSVDVANVNQLVISKVLSIAVVGPAIHQLLPGDLAQEFIRVVNDEWDLDVLRDVPSFFDLSVAVLQDSGL